MLRIRLTLIVEAEVTVDERADDWPRRGDASESTVVEVVRQEIQSNLQSVGYVRSCDVEVVASRVKEVR